MSWCLLIGIVCTNIYALLVNSRANMSLGHQQSSPATELVMSYCQVCDVAIMGPVDGANYLQHTGGKVHKKKAAAAAAAPQAPATPCGATTVGITSAAGGGGVSVLSEWPPEAPFISLTPSGPVRSEELHRVLTYRLVSRDELSNGRHASASGNSAPSPLANVTDAHYYNHVVRTVLQHRPDVFVLQHVAGSSLKELTRAFVRQPIAKDTYEWFPSPRLPEGTQPWTHHFLGYRREKYRMLEQHPIMLHELVASRGRQDTFCEQAMSTACLAMDHAVAWVVLLEDARQRAGGATQSLARLILVSVELPHSPDLSMFRTCCVREIQRHIATLTVDESVSREPPSVVILGDFGAAPLFDGPLQGSARTTDMYTHLGALSDPLREVLPLTLIKDSLVVTQTTLPSDASGAEQRLYRCNAWFDCTPQSVGQHDHIVSLDVLNRRGDLGSKRRRIHKLFAWDGHKLVGLLPLPPDATDSVFCIPLNKVWENTNQRRGVVEWEEWGSALESALTIDREASMQFVQDAVHVNGVHNAMLLPLKEKPKRMRNCFRSGRWDDAVPGMFRSAYSHYQLCCNAPQVPKDDPHEVERIISNLEASLCPPQPAPYVGGPFVSSSLSPTTDHSDVVLRSVLQRFLHPPPAAITSVPSLSPVCAASTTLRDWLRQHPSSPLRLAPSSTPQAVWEPHFTCFVPMRCDPLPGLVTPCRTTNFTTHFDRRRWLERYGGFEWGTYDYVMYLRDRMEVVKISRLPSVAEVGCGGLPTLDLRHPSTHLPLCVEFWVPW